MIRSLLLALVALTVSVVPASARAQTRSQTIQALALVDVALIAQTLSDVNFGYLTPGVTQTITPSATASCAGCTAGVWSFQNIFSGNQPTRRNAAMTFTQLPSVLTSTTGATLNVTWANAARVCLGKGGVEYYCFAPYTPVQGVARLHQINGPGAPGTALEPSGGGRRDLNMYLGATITPAAGQRAGYYAGVVTLQFAYSN